MSIANIQTSVNSLAVNSLAAEMAQHREELWKLSSSVHFEESEIEDRRRKIFADEAKLMGNMIDRCFIGFSQMHDKLNDLEARQTQTHVMITWQIKSQSFLDSCRNLPETPSCFPIWDFTQA